MLNQFIALDLIYNFRSKPDIYNGILLSHKYEQNNVICSNMDGHTDCHFEWSKLDDGKYHMILLIWCCSVSMSCLILCDPMDCSMPGYALLSCTIFQGLFKCMSIESVMLSNHHILCHILLLWPSIFPSIQVFSMRQLFTWGDQSIKASASASVFLMNVQGWFPLGLISLLSKDLSRVFFSTAIQKH